MTVDDEHASYAMPPEWAPHEATWLAWPHDPMTWAGGVEAAEEVYLDMVRALARGERVEMLVPDEETKKRAQARLFETGLDVATWSNAQGHDLPTRGFVRLHVVDYADSWVRDTGPTIVKGHTGDRLAIDWRFDAWGGKYESLKRDDRLAAVLAERAGLEHIRVDTVLEGGAFDVDGEGLVLTTEQCLLNPNRGSDRDKAAMEELLTTFLGAERVLWLGEGIEGDDTDGHVDDIARFIGPGHVLACRQPDEDDPDHTPLEANLDRLSQMETLDGSPLEVTTVPMPDPVTFERERLPASYANFYIGNKAVLLPVYGCEADREAEAILANAFPDRRIVPIEAEPLIVGFGACHCLTQQLPA